MQVSSGTPVGLGDINLRAPGRPLSLQGSGRSRSRSPDRSTGISGTYAFQGRRFDVVEGSSINFRGDLNPEMYVTVTRVISGVETRVSIFGPLRQPELRLASTPPLDESDILSLIVFNTSTNLLSPGQQQELLVRAGTLAAGFLATPILQAIENEMGLDIFEIDAPGDSGARARRSRSATRSRPASWHGSAGSSARRPTTRLTVEYDLSRLFRIRATFSDAQSLIARSPFRRVERAGIDLLLFFSY